MTSWLLRQRSGLCAHSWNGTALLIVALCALFPLAASSQAQAPTGSLSFQSLGLPPGQTASIVVDGHGVHRAVEASSASFTDLPPGSYRVTVKPVRIGRSSGRVLAGAIAYPAKPRLEIAVTAGNVTQIAAAYAGVVNPRVHRLRARVLRVRGGARKPKALLVRRAHGIRRGNILTSGRTRKLPYGLLSRVTAVRHTRRGVLVKLTPVALSDATPSLTYSGNLALTPAPGAVTGASAHAAGAKCSPPKLLKFGAHLDQVQLRDAFLGAWPPQLRLSLAVRTTESLGVAAAAAGINCDWDLLNLGPYQAAIPVGPIVVPVFATIPVKAGVHINGRLEAGIFNVASTTVASIAAGFDSNYADLGEQGSNVWVSGAPSLDGSAKLSASIGVQAGIGVAKGANVHLEADFGPELDWSSGHSCNLVLNLGALTAGVRAFGKDLNAPPWKPFNKTLWTGCTPSSPNGGDSPGNTPSGGSNTPTGGGTTPSGPSGPSGGGSPPQPPPPQTWSEQETPNHPVNTFTNYHNASGMGPAIAAGQWVQVSCKVYDPTIMSVNPDGYWYRIATSPWNNAYYSPANTFMNGDPYGGPYTHNTDFAVSNC